MLLDKRFNIMNMNMLFLPKLICKFNMIPLQKLLVGLLLELDSLTLKTIWKNKQARIVLKNSRKE